VRDIKFRYFNSGNSSMWFFDAYSDAPVMEGDLPECILMQYTGLKDKNGVEIYEGDLISNERGRTAQVTFHAYTAGFDCDFVSDDGTCWAGIDKAQGFKPVDWLTYVEVIGNIHENPELLK